MKKLTQLIGTAALYAGLSMGCASVNIRYGLNADFYKMDAYFGKNDTIEVVVCKFPSQSTGTPFTAKDFVSIDGYEMGIEDFSINFVMNGRETEDCVRQYWREKD